MSFSLNDKQIKEYKEMHKRRFGEELSDEEATRAATRLVRLVKAVYGGVRDDAPENGENHTDEANHKNV